MTISSRFTRTLAALLAVLILALSLAGCGSSAPASSAGEEGEDKLQIVCTVFPLYDWARQLTQGSDNVEVSLLLKGGTDLHSYQPTAQDILTVASADLFFYVGGESDFWVADVMEQAPDKERIALNAMEHLSDRLMHEAPPRGAEDGHDHEHEDGVPYDEHIWLSLENARIVCAALSEALAQLDAGNAQLYADNAAAYDEALAAMDAEFRTTLETAPRHTLLVGDRFPFSYLAADYGLDCYAAFAGCSAESEASFETVAFLADKLETEHLPAVLVLENSDGKLADTIIQNTSTKDQQVLTLNSMQSVSGSQGEEGADYLELMQQNLDTLLTALS